MKTISFSFIALMFYVSATMSWAHDMRPLYVDIQEQGSNVFAVMWKVPVTVAATNVPEIKLPATCHPASPATGRFSRSIPTSRA